MVGLRQVVGVAVLATALALPTTSSPAPAAAQTAAEPGVELPVPAGAPAGWRQISASPYQSPSASGHTCGVLTTGHLYCWGADSFGELGNDEALVDQPVPAEVAGGDADWASVGAGEFHTCARKTSGRLYCWGHDGNGRLGNDTIIHDRASPVQVAGQATDWVAVSAGSFHTCARKTSGRLYCWGSDGYGRLGDDATI